MEPDEALEVIKSLAAGIDPLSGEVFSKDSPYQHPTVIRALFAAAKALERPEAPAKVKRPLPGKAGKPWTMEEDQELAKAFDERILISELAKSHDRTTGAVRARLVRLGKIPPISVSRDI